MKISQPIKTAVGVSTIWLLIYPVFFIGVFAVSMLGIMATDQSEFFPASLFSLVFPLHCLTFIVQIGLLIFYLAHVIKNEAASDTIRILFGIGIFFMPYLAMPFYYYIYIWRDTPPDWAVQQPNSSKMTNLPQDEFVINTAVTTTPKSDNSKKIILVTTLIGALVVAALAAAGLLFFRYISDINQSILEEAGIFDFPPESVPARTVLTTDNLQQLWTKELDIEDPHKVYVDLFTPDDKSIVFWSPEHDLLISLDAVTGERLWETAVPSHSTMRLYDGKFFVVGYEWFDLLEDAPVNLLLTPPNCSFGGQATVLVIDPQTGDRLWGYVYQGVDSYDIYFDDTSFYLTGSHDHGASRSVTQVDIDTGEVQYLDCYKWPQPEKQLLSVPGNEGTSYPPYRVIRDENDFRFGNAALYFVPEGNQLEILDGPTQTLKGTIQFEGADLNPWDINVTVQSGVAIIYMLDSDQFFAFKLPD